VIKVCAGMGTPKYLEWMLALDVASMEFKNQSEAIEFLQRKGFRDCEVKEMRFIAVDK